MDVGGPLSGLCHWFAVNPEKTLQDTLHRPGIEKLHLNRHLITNEIPSRAADGHVKTDLMISSQLHESTSISIIMILATVLFILLITAFVTCITRKKRRPQVRIMVLSSVYLEQHRSNIYSTYKRISHLDVIIKLMDWFNKEFEWAINGLIIET